jgi:hypothetical protein
MFDYWDLLHNKHSINIYEYICTIYVCVCACECTCMPPPRHTHTHTHRHTHAFIHFSDTVILQEIHKL